MAYITTVLGYQDRSVLPAQYVTDLELIYPGWIVRNLADLSAWIDARLVKRYPIPFQAPFPPIVVRWLVQMQDLDSLLKMGVQTTDQQYVKVEEKATRATDEIKEAANAKDSLFGLPAIVDDNTPNKGGPLGYAEVSPYDWFRNQRDRVDSR